MDKDVSFVTWNLLFFLAEIVFHRRRGPSPNRVEFFLPYPAWMFFSYRFTRSSNFPSDEISQLKLCRVHKREKNAGKTKKKHTFSILLPVLVGSFTIVIHPQRLINNVEEGRTNGRIYETCLNSRFHFPPTFSLLSLVVHGCKNVFRTCFPKTRFSFGYFD